MLKKLATILVFIACSWTVQSQVSLPFREEAPIAADLYWTKAFDLVEDQRFDEVLKLLAVLAESSMGICTGFDNAYIDLKETIGKQNQAEVDRALTQLITQSIVLEIYALNTIPDVKVRKTMVINLFKELIAIQKYIKEIDFDTYRQLVNCFRRLNQLHVDPVRMKQFIEAQEFLIKYQLKCWIEC